MSDLQLHIRLGDTKTEKITCKSTDSIANLKELAASALKITDVSSHYFILVSHAQDVVNLGGAGQTADVKENSPLSELGVPSQASVFVINPNATKPVRRIRREKPGAETATEPDKDFEQTLTVDNIATKIASAKGAQKEACLVWIDKHGKKVFESKAPLSFSKEILQTILKRDTLACKEIDVFEAVLRWGKAKSKSDTPDALKATLKDLVELIRFPTMTTQDIATKVVPTGLLNPAQTLQLFTYVSTADRKEKSGEKLELSGDLKCFSNTKRKSGEIKYINYEFSGTYSASPYGIAGSNLIEHLNDHTDRTLMRGICATSPGWINIELQDKIPIYEIEIGGWNGNSSLWSVTNGSGATIQTSNDKSSWQTVGTIPSGFGSTIQRVTLTKTEAKFVRFQHNSYLGLGFFRILPVE